MNRRLEKAADLCYSVKMSGIRRETASGRAAGAAKVSDIMICQTIVEMISMRLEAAASYHHREVSYEDMEPGDLVCYSGHVAMYIGDGRIVHASSTKEGIKVGYDPAYRTIVSVRRPWQS